jgi:hypothetical protein
MKAASSCWQSLYSDRRFGAGDFPPSSMTLCNSDSRIIVREPTFVRCNFPWLSQRETVHLLKQQMSQFPD